MLDDIEDFLTNHPHYDRDHVVQIESSCATSDIPYCRECHDWHETHEECSSVD